MSTYLLINALIILFPLAATFDKRLEYYKKLKAVLFSILVVGIPFVLWDAFFTARGIWVFNPSHLLGLKVLGLPIEEVLFFVTVPYSCLFLYEAVKKYTKEGEFAFGTKMFAVLTVLFLAAALFFNSKTYTSIVLLACAITNLLAIWLKPSLPKSLNYWKFIALTFCLFIIFNYALTSIPVVVYNDLENTAIRILSIPIEDFFYNYSLLTLSLLAYQLKKK